MQSEVDGAFRRHARRHGSPPNCSQLFRVAMAVCHRAVSRLQMQAPYFYITSEEKGKRTLHMGYSASDNRACLLKAR